MTPHLDLKVNAFRILGLEADAFRSLARYRASKLGAALNGGQVPSFWSDSPVFVPPERTHETIAVALQRLENPFTRLLDEASWFHLSEATDVAAVAALAKGNQARAIALWDEAVARSADLLGRLHYQHNRAVLYLWLAEMPARPVEAPRNAWDRAIEAWVPLLTNETFWRSLVDHSPVGRDPRLPAGTPQVLRAEVAYALVRGCGRQAVEGFAAQHGEVLEALTQFIQIRLDAAQVALAWSRGRSPDVESLEPRLCFSRMAFEQLQALGPPEAAALHAAGDSLVETYRRLAHYYAKQGEDTAKALTLVETATTIPASSGAQTRLKEDARHLQWTLTADVFQKAVDAGDYAAAQRALKVLEQYRDPAASLDVLEPYRRGLQNLRKPRSDATAQRLPRPRTICGIGTRWYGRPKEDPQARPYFATVFFTCFFLPLFALARYQVGPRTAQRAPAYRRTPLTLGHWVWNLVVLTALLALLALGAYKASQIMPRLSPLLSGSPLERPLPIPGDLSSGWSQLRAELERRRSILRAEREALQAEREAIDREWSDLEVLRVRIEGRGGGPPDGLPAGDPHRDQAVAEYNRRLSALRARVEAYTVRAEAARRAIAEFNALVKGSEGGSRESQGETPQDMKTLE